MQTGEHLATLQAQVLRAVLERSRLLGSERIVDLPDLSFVLDQETIYVSDENLAAPINLPMMDKPIRVVSRADLRRRTQTEPRVAFLEFSQPEDSESEIGFGLGIRMLAGDEPTAVSLSSVLVRFRVVDDGWALAGEPVYLAA